MSKFVIWFGLGGGFGGATNHVVEERMGKNVVLEYEPSEYYELAVEKLEQAKQRVVKNYCSNPSGVLWESVWIHEDGKFKQLTIASGLFDNRWRVFKDEESAIKKMIEELKAIKSARQK